MIHVMTVVVTFRFVAGTSTSWFVCKIFDISTALAFFSTIINCYLIGIWRCIPRATTMTSVRISKLSCKNKSEDIRDVKRAIAYITIENFTMFVMFVLNIPISPEFLFHTIWSKQLLCAPAQSKLQVSPLYLEQDCPCSQATYVHCFSDIQSSLQESRVSIPLLSHPA